MSRTTAEAVELILGGHYNGTTDLEPFIETATAVVDQVVICATNKGVTLSDAALEVMERWLSGYYYSLSDPPYKSKSTGRASATFIDIDLTKPAMAVDSSGCLAAILAGARRGAIYWLGKPRSQQIDYVDRD